MASSSVCSPLFPSLRLPTSCCTRSSAPHAVSSSTDRAVVAAATRPAPLAVASHRRKLVLGAALSALFLKTPLSVGAGEVEVVTYLPPAPSNPGFVFFRTNPSPQGHPCPPRWQCGTLRVHSAADLEASASGQHPPTWKQARVANILSGNYCQPKCAEPWVEVKFEDEKQGKVQVVASPLIRLTNKPNAAIEDISSPEKLIASLGPFVTGNTFDSDELIGTSIEKIGDQTYYTYVLKTPLALTGSHGGALRRKRQRQTVAAVREGSEDHSRLISSMIAASAICEVVNFDGVFGNLGLGLRLETELLL